MYKHIIDPVLFWKLLHNISRNFWHIVLPVPLAMLYRKIHTYYFCKPAIFSFTLLFCSILAALFQMHHPYSSDLCWFDSFGIAIVNLATIFTCQESTFTFSVEGSVWSLNNYSIRSYTSFDGLRIKPIHPDCIW